MIDCHLEVEMVPDSPRTPYIEMEMGAKDQVYDHKGGPMQVAWKQNMIRAGTIRRPTC